MKNLKTYENFKRIIGGSKLAFAGIAGAGTLVLTACTTEVKPEVEPVVTVTSEVSSEVPSVVYDNSEVPSEELSEEVEDVEMPEFILYDENGDLYVPQEVKPADIYAKIDEATKKYNFANDWERDRYVGILLIRNSHYMSDEDIDLIYSDYLTNFGGGNVVQQEGYELTSFVDKTNKIDLKDYYIDERLAAEAEKIENYYRDGDINRYKTEFIKNVEIVNENENLEDYYNSLFYVYEMIIHSNPYSGSEKTEFQNYEDYGIASIYHSVNNGDTISIQISDYVSSHKEKIK